MIRWLRERRGFTLAGLLFAGSLLVYNANLRGIGSYDSLATSILPFDLWRGEGIGLDRYAGLPSVIRYSITSGRDGHLYPTYPILTALLVAPLYAPAAVFPGFNADTAWRPVMEKLSASIVASLAVLLLFLALRRLVSSSRAFLLAVLFALGTSTWVISSQALWQHGVGELLLAGALVLLLRPELDARALVGLGGLAGLLVANRPPDLFLAAGVMLAVAMRVGRRAWVAVVPAAIVGVALAAYDLAYFGNLVGGYTSLPGADLAGFSFANAAGLLFGSRGLLIYSPFLLAALAVRTVPPVLRRTWWCLLGGWVATFILYGCYRWQAGFCYGPRYSTDGLPILFVFLALATQRPWGALAKILGGVAASLAIALQCVGAFFFASGASGAVPAMWRWEAISAGAALAGGPATPDWAVIVYPSLRERRSLAPDAMRGRLSFVAPPPSTARKLSYIPVRIRLENTSARTWSSVGTWFGLHAVRLGVTFVSDERPGDAPRVADYWLRTRLRPGETLERTYWIRSPPFAGRWTLEVQPVQRTATTFEPFAEHGFTPVRASITLTED